MDELSTFQLSSLPTSIRNQIKKIVTMFPFIIMIITWSLSAWSSVITIFGLVALINPETPITWQKVFCILLASLIIGLIAAILSYYYVYRKIKAHMKVLGIVIGSEDMLGLLKDPSKKS